jgi:3'(2'), 5'-bisphosphate nucleotidase
MKLTALLAPLSAIAREAGAVILEVYQRSESISVTHKDDASPLTEADLRANDLICRGLAGLPEAYPIISEENRLQPYEERARYHRCWLVDPLDGTKEFVKRNGEFTVNIALVEAGRPILGIIYVPVSGQLFAGCTGEGSYLEENGNRSPLQAASFSEQDAGLRLVCSRSHLNEATQEQVARFREPELVSRGSSLKFMLLAQGLAHVYPRMAPTMEWDTAAAQIILEEAGGAVLNAHSGQPLHYNKPDLLNPFFVAKGVVSYEL